ncbi:MAG TPA: methyltransferase domain-containing protein, partial [Verrucomicrobiae bacterium]|nr:methyltransferase domain-containing protein [Verrucomicrobiae bacterium]
GSLLRFHRGAFELAIQLRQDILPIVLCDTWMAMPRDAYWFEPYHTTVRAWPRVTPQTFDYSLGARALMRHCEQLVEASLQAQLGQINTPRVLRRKVGRLYRYLGKFVEQFVYWKMKGDPLFHSLPAVVPRQGFILDLGCGYGVPAHWLSYDSDARTVLGVDYDEVKVRIAQRTAQGHARVEFQYQDILTWTYPACDVVLLLDVLHYWPPDVQAQILAKAFGALRPGGLLILREAAREATAGHQRVERWEKFATRIGHNKATRLYFQSIAELTAAVRRAGFGECTLQEGGGRDSNVMVVASRAG